MIRISQLKLPVDHAPEDLLKKAAKILRIAPGDIRTFQIRRQSLDARKKPELFYSYTLDIGTERDAEVVRRAKSPDIVLCRKETYRFPESGEGRMSGRPVIVGTGPAGIFCGLMLARHGYRPILLERGEDLDTRVGRVERFWQTKELDLRSNVQFGEGGAGTFSDGKLNTLVKDPAMRNQYVLEQFAEFGADSRILYQNKPHIGTDVLGGVVKSMREEIIRLGGEVRFACRMTELLQKNGAVCGVRTEDGGTIETGIVVLAVGHSARDTFESLAAAEVPMEAKSFAVGLRVQHPQKMINLSQYGREDAGNLGAASYKLTKKTSGGRGVYSFCMCPGGYVVNASSELNRLAINGMSYHARDGVNANSALIVTVTPEDFPDRTALGGVAYQRELERLAYACAGGDIPVQLYRDFKENRLGTELGEVAPQMKGSWAFANLREIFPEPLSLALLEGMESFGHMIRGFDRPDAVFAGIESRTSSPLRILRDASFQSTLRGLYPCGEGAGYAGGITSAAMDGIKAAEAIARAYAPL